MTHAHLIQPDPRRCPILVAPRDGGGWSLTAGRTRLHLNTDETTELISIIKGNNHG